MSGSSSTTSCDADGLPLRDVPGGISLTVRLSPRARGDRLDGIARGVDGAPMLRVSVTAPPLDSRANDALLRLLAKEWRVARRDLAIVGGAKSRNKIVRLAGDPPALRRRLAAALAALPRL